MRIAILSAAPAGCGEPSAVGEVNQIVVAISAELREALGDDLRFALEPREFVVRDERVFDVAYIDPRDTAWERLRVLRHILLIGSADEPLIAEALASNRHGSRLDPPAVIQLSDVWAKRQTVTVALLPPEAGADEVTDLLQSTGDAYLRQFEDLVQARTALREMNTSAASRFQRELGFTLSLPARYQHEERGPGVFTFRDEQPDPTMPVIRFVTVESRAVGEVDWSAAGAGAWRADLGKRLNQPPQITRALPTALQGVRSGGRVIEIRGTWTNPEGEWPAAGPFITHLVECPERVFLVDAWLYAPASEKYELMFQINRILNTFHCSAA